MLQKSTLDFLKSLKKNNNRIWFENNRAKYETAKNDFEIFVNNLISALSKNDPKLKDAKAKDCMFRIYRDVRFSKNKAPYKTNFGAVVDEGGRKSDKACFYIQVEPGNTFVAGGRWMPEPDDLREIRKEIFYNTKKFKKILSGKSFKKYFGKLSDVKLKLPPKGFDKNFPDIELLKYTSFIVDNYLGDEKLLSENIFTLCSDVHKAMLPLLEFLNEATN
ncbi:MAG: DUF2461 domain-containing protein [Bacteroidia bacterium]